MSWCNLLENCFQKYFLLPMPKEKRRTVIDQKVFIREYCSRSYYGAHGILNIDSKINCHLCVLSFFHIDWSFHMYCCRFLTNMTKFGISLSLYVLMNPVFVSWCSQKNRKGFLTNSTCIYVTKFCLSTYIIKSYSKYKIFTKHWNDLWFGSKLEITMILNDKKTRYCWLSQFCNIIIKEDVLITRLNHQLKFAVHCSQVIFGFKSRIKFAISLRTCSFRMFTVMEA